MRLFVWALCCQSDFSCFTHTTNLCSGHSDRTIQSSLQGISRIFRSRRFVLSIRIIHVRPLQCRLQCRRSMHCVTYQVDQIVVMITIEMMYHIPIPNRKPEQLRLSVLRSALILSTINCVGCDHSQFAGSFQSYASGIARCSPFH